MFINDFMENVESSGKLFADDAKLHRKIRTASGQEKNTIGQQQATGVEQQLATTVQQGQVEGQAHRKRQS